MSDSRAEFEVWAISDDGPLYVSEIGRNHVGDYVCLDAAIAWDAWQASRAQPERKMTDAAAQVPDAWTWDTLIPNTNYHSAHFGFTKPEADDRILNLTPLYAGAPDQPAIAVAIKYPEEWDTAAYPTLESALHELQAWHKVCKEQEAETLAAQPAAATVPDECELIEIGQLVEIDDGFGQSPNTIFAEWNDARHKLPAGTKIYVKAAQAQDDGEQA